MEEEPLRGSLFDFVPNYPAIGIKKEDGEFLLAYEEEVKMTVVETEYLEFDGTSMVGILHSVNFCKCSGVWGCFDGHSHCPFVDPNECVT